MSSHAGVEDDGYPRGLGAQDLELSVQTLTAMTQAVNAALQPLKELPASKGRSYLIVRVYRLCLDELAYTDLCIAGQLSLATCFPERKCNIMRQYKRASSDEHAKLHHDL